MSDLQGNVQDLQEALDKEVAVHKDSQSTLEEAYRHRRRLEARYIGNLPTTMVAMTAHGHVSLSDHMCENSIFDSYGLIAVARQI